MTPGGPRPTSGTVLFVLASYRRDAPAGIERAIAGLTTGLNATGHRSLIATAAPHPPDDPDVVPLQLPVSFPCDDDALRACIENNRPALAAQLGALAARTRADVIVYADALWGLGRIAADLPVRAVLAVHVVGDPQDLRPALDSADTVISPSATVLHEANAQGYRTDSWRVVPNPLLIDPDDVPRPDAAEREQLRRRGPVRVAARLGREKGVLELLAARPSGPRTRPVEVTLARAGFEEHPGGQTTLLAACQTAATAAGATLHPPLRWAQVPAWLARAAVTIVPSLRETFGLVAAESLSAGTPVIAYSVGNLPDLIGDAGILVPPDRGPAGLWEAVKTLLTDPLRYSATCGAAYYRSRDYRPTTVADAFLKAVW
ncbi:glycosyltransferase family 4 protein [Pseudofrankia sp. DC12]|uniref:glycosyltransferase family 4 protein n=1 Tax=Pseudofrankia sp. DC12 TaxID=683315 RepID=UPI0005F78120|nr:glycosyltransferase family 4 protein [Pseudofrankia sp. DC12]